MRTDLIRAALASAIVSLVVVVSPVRLTASAPEPTDPPAEVPAPEDSTPAEPLPDEPAETRPLDGEEAPPEPGDVPVAVWVGVILLVLVAVIWAIRQSARSSASRGP